MNLCKGLQEPIFGVIHIRRQLCGGVWGIRQWDVIERSRVGGLASVLDVQYLLIWLKKIGFAPRLDILLSQSLIDYWQEILLLTLTSNSEAILSWYQCISYGLNRTTERAVNLNVMLVGFVFFRFRLCTCTVQLLLHSFFTFSSCENKAGWLQNQYWKCQ